MVEFIGVGDDDEVLLAYGLPEFKLTGEGRDVGFGCVAPRLVEEGLHVELLLVGNDVPSSELLEHRHVGLILWILLRRTDCRQHRRWLQRQLHQ